MIEDNNDLLQIYLDELEEIEVLDSQEELRLMCQAKSGNKTSRNKIIESRLKFALSLLKDYMAKGMSVQELVGETNLLLIGSIDSYKDGEVDKHIESVIREGLDRILKNAENEKTAMEHIAEEANMLAEISKLMATELGRQASVEELSERTMLSKEEVEEILKMTLQALGD